MTISVAVITDIHGNLPALEAALARIDELGIEQIYCGGDLVGYGPWPNEVCELIQERGIPTIYGNYDYAIGRDEEDCMCAYPNQHDRELGQLSVNWTLENTSRASKDFMRGLPFDLRFELGGKRVLLVHGSPRKVNEYLFEDKPAKTFERIAAGADCDVMVFGHTHKPWIHYLRRHALRQLRVRRQAQGRRSARGLRHPRGHRRRGRSADRALRVRRGVCREPGRRLRAAWGVRREAARRRLMRSDAAAVPAPVRRVPRLGLPRRRR